MRAWTPLMLVGILIAGTFVGAAFATSPASPGVGGPRYFMVPADNTRSLPSGAHVLEEYAAFHFVSAPERPDVPGTVEMSYDVNLWGIGERFDPISALPAIPQGYEDPWAAVAEGEPVYGIVQYRAPMRESWHTQARSTGVDLIQPLSGFAYIVRGVKASLADLASAPEVRWVGEFHHYYKFSAGLGEKLRTSDPGSEGLFWMNVFAQDADKIPAIIDAVIAGGGRIRETWQFGDWPHMIQFYAKWSEIPRLVKWRGVFTLEPYELPHIYNELSSWAIQTDVTNDRKLFTKGITGKGVVLSVADTGVTPTHENFQGPGKIVRYAAACGSANTQDEGGHGTHVAGSVLGDGQTYGQYDPTKQDGMSIDARLSFQDISSSGGGLVCTTPSSNAVQAQIDGAIGQQNSWGSDCNGVYQSSSRDADQYMWDHPEWLFSFSAANSGPSRDTIGCPATAKNILTVGATARGGSKSLASFSSRGPTDDGRIKPTIVAPGQSIMSVARSGGYTSMSGTSMSGPTALGMNGLTQQYLKEGWYPGGSKGSGTGFQPSAAMMKAVLVNSGLDLKAAGGNAALNIPDLQDQGFGKIKLDDTLFFAGETRTLWLIDGYNASSGANGLKTGEKADYILDVKAGEPLKIDLVWNDFPGANLVNNLNLKVTSPTGKVYVGNDMTNGESDAGGTTADSKNVEELFNVMSPEAGKYTVTVEAVQVAQADKSGGQMYAVVATGNVTGPGGGGSSVVFDTPVAGNLLKGGGPADVTYHSTGSVQDGTVALEYSTDGTLWKSIAASQPKQGTYSWSVPAIDAPKVELQAKAKDASGNNVTSKSGVFKIDGTPPTSTVSALPAYTTKRDFGVAFTATDSLSGVKSVEIHYRVDGAAAVKAGESPASPFNFTAPKDGSYEFHSVGIDNVGHVEAAPGTADAKTVVDTVPPSVSSTNPANNAVDVLAISKVELMWSEAMDPASAQGAFGANPAITCAWSWPDTKTQVCTPSSLRFEQKYDLTVSVAAKDLAGNALAAAKTFSFTTAKPDTTPPAIVHAAVTASEDGVMIPISATVTDAESGVDTVTMFYRREGASSYVSSPMTLNSSQADRFDAAIPATVATPGTIEYYLEASDRAGNKATDPAAGATSPHKIAVKAKAGPGILGFLTQELAGLPIWLLLLLVVVVIALVAALARRKKRPAMQPSMFAEQGGWTPGPAAGPSPPYSGYGGESYPVTGEPMPPTTPPPPPDSSLPASPPTVLPP